MNIILNRLKLFKYIISLRTNCSNLTNTDKIHIWAKESVDFYNAIWRNKANRIEKRHIPILRGDPLMYVSDKYKFAWNLMPKAASTSIAKIVQTLCDDDTEKVLFSRHFMQPCQLWGLSRTMSRRFEPWNRPKRNKPKYKYESYYHFVFVRNPWSRLVSLYKDKFKRSKDPGEGIMRPYEIQNVHLMKFEDFVKFLENIPDGYCDLHFLPYHYHINLQKTDFVGKLENFEDDMRYVLNIIAPDRHIEIPKLNSSKYGEESYRDYYTDETRDIVARKYAKDIELFDYQF